MGEDEIGRTLRHQQGQKVAPAKKKANPRTRKQPEPTSDATDRLAAPAAKKKCGVHARSGAIGVSAAGPMTRVLIVLERKLRKDPQGHHPTMRLTA